MSLDFSITKTCTHCEHTESVEFSITHNLAKMASEAGVHNSLWRPNESGYDVAGMIIPNLKNGIKAMEWNPDEFMALNPKNGWGNYDDFLLCLKNILTACEEHPDYNIEISR